jgi:hypothetical protein
VNRKSAAVFVVLPLLVLALVPAGLAAKGGNAGTNGNGGGGPGATPSATLYSSCNPCAVGTMVTFSGSGYDGSQPRGMAQIRDSAGGTTWIGINVASDGTTSFELYMSPAGTYDVKVLQDQHRKMVLKAELAGLVVQ